MEVLRYSALNPVTRSWNNYSGLPHIYLCSSLRSVFSSEYILQVHRLFSMRIFDSEMDSNFYSKMPGIERCSTTVLRLVIHVYEHSQPPSRMVSQLQGQE